MRADAELRAGAVAGATGSSRRSRSFRRPPGVRQQEPADRDQPHAATFVVEDEGGTAATANLVEILPELDRRSLNVKVVAAISPQLFARQDAAHREATASATDRWDAMAITTGAYRQMADRLDVPVAREYSLSSDWDDRWRTGGTVEEVVEEAHLDRDHILGAIERFVGDRRRRRSLLQRVSSRVDDR